MTEKGFQILSLLENFNSSYDTIGRVQTAIKQLEALTNEYMLEIVHKKDLPKDVKCRLDKILSSYKFSFETIIKPQVNQRPPKRVDDGFIVYDPHITYSVELVKTGEQILSEIENTVVILIEETTPSFMKKGRSMKQLLKSFQDRIDLSSNEDESSNDKFVNEVLESLLIKNFDISLIKETKLGDKYGNPDFFEIDVMSNITREKVTSPAIIRKFDGIEEVILKGTLLIPEVKSQTYE